MHEFEEKKKKNEPLYPFPAVFKNSCLIMAFKIEKKLHMFAVSAH